MQRKQARKADTRYAKVEWAQKAHDLWKSGKSFGQIRKILNLSVSRTRVHQVVMRERTGSSYPQRKKPA